MKIRKRAKRVPWLYLTCKDHPGRTTTTRVYGTQLVIECAVPDCDNTVATLYLKDAIPETEDKILTEH